MAAKRTQPTRIEQFRARRRKSWTRFLMRVGVFVVPVVLLTLWLITTYLIPKGQTVPILVLDYTSDSGATAARIASGQDWRRTDYRISRDKPLELPPGLAFGGPGNDVLFVFADVLGDARKVDGSELPRACVFEPSDNGEHLTHRWRGLVDRETNEEKDQWVSFENYISKLADAVATATVTAGQRKKVILLLDVDHPDLPARSVPQANAFCQLASEQWNEHRQRLNHSFDLYVWLSHSPGQISYLDSDYDNVESFFKRRFELAMTGGVLTLDGRAGGNDVTYADLKRYLDRSVSSDASIHKLAQTIQFLEPDSTSNDRYDFPVLRFSSPAQLTPGLGQLFDYPSRAPNNAIDRRWAEIESVSASRKWTLENPLLLQRATMLALQLEKIWYAGHGDTNLSGNLNRELAAILASPAALPPVFNSLRDAQQAIPSSEVQPLRREWLTTIEDSPVEPAAEGSSSPPTLSPKDQRKKRTEEISRWKAQLPVWNTSFSVWESFLGSQGSRQEFAAALALLDDSSVTADYSEQAGQLAGLSRVMWNEIAWLRRIADELVWPDGGDDLARFQELVHLSIRVRDASNQFAAELTPALTWRFTEAFAEIENDRRLLEDRLFANEEPRELKSQLEDLLDRYLSLDRRHETMLAGFQLLQRQLIVAPHDLRYASESLPVQLQFAAGGRSQSPGSPLETFSAWLDGDADGFTTWWNRLGGQMVGALPDRSSDDTANPMAEFSMIRQGGYVGGVSDGSGDLSLASNPYVDYQRFTREVLEQGAGNIQSMGVADRNLLSRRLLAWPGIDLEVRKEIRDGVCTQRVNVNVGGTGKIGEATGGAADASGDAAEEFVALPKVAQQKLSELFRHKAYQWLTESDRPVALSPDTNQREDVFVRSAWAAHRLPIEANDESANNLFVAISTLRNEKSSLIAGRIANDLWGSPPSDTGSPYALAALSNQLVLTRHRIESLTVADAVRNRIADEWTQGPGPRSEAMLEQVTQFSKSFRNWTWQRDKQMASNTSIAGDLQTLQESGNSTVISVREPEAGYSSVAGVTFDNANGGVGPIEFVGNELDIYLRGHHKLLSVTRPRVRQADKTYAILIDKSNAQGTQIIVQRAKTGPVSGHITLVIDCSRSMASGNRMRRAKDDVNEFLKWISQRGDIAVSLVAIGASENWNTTKKSWSMRPPSELPDWTKDPEADVWTYAGGGKVVDDSSLPGLMQAVGELKQFGETPILAGLDTAIKIDGVGQGAPNLIVLLTDGFEFGNRGRRPNEKYAAFNHPMYDSLSQKLHGDSELVVFSMLTDGVQQSFKSMIDAGFPLHEIESRINKIESLATINRRASDISLSRFFKNLLPQPEVFVTGEGNPPLSRRQNVADGVDLSGDGQLSERERRVMAAIELGVNERPQRWSAGIEFSQEAVGEAARSFARQPAAWRTSTPLSGNEVLEFDFDPFRPSFTLTTAKIANAKRIDFAGQTVQVSKTSNRLRKPEFEIASAAGDQLTPAPALSFVTFQNSNKPELAVLMQDFNLNQQPRSNVHPLEFPEFTDSHRAAMFGSEAVDLKLHLIGRLTPQFWSRIRFTQSDPWKIENDQEQDGDLQAGQYVSIKSLLPQAPPFDQFEIEMRRDNPAGDVAEFYIRIQATDPKQRLDSWLVQVLDADGNLNRDINQRSQRNYVFRQLPNGSKKLQAIEHQFTIVKRELQKRPAWFGLAHLKNLADVEQADVTWPNYFRQP